jgi:choline kinase
VSIDTAVIMAAGFGSRIPEFSRHGPKGFINVGGQPIVERSVDILVRHGVRRIIIGTGYRAMDYAGLAKRYQDARIECAHNADYANSGSLETLLRCIEGLDCDFLSLESDLLYDSRMIEHILRSPYRNVILASGETQSGDEVYIETNDRSELVNLSKDPSALSRIDAELVGICKLAAETPRALKQWLAQAGLARPAQLHYEEGLVGIAGRVSLHVDKVDMPWTEIDTPEHLERAKQLIWPRIESAEKGLP